MKTHALGFSCGISIVAFLAAAPVRAQSVDGDVTVRVEAPASPAAIPDAPAEYCAPPAPAVVASPSERPAGAPAATDPPRNALTVDLIGLAFGIVGIEYERALGDRVSLYVQPRIGLWDGLDNAGYDALGLGVITGARFFVTGVAPEGFWLGPQVAFGWVSLDSGTVSASGTGLAVTALLGYTWLIGDVVDLSLGLGGGYGRIRVTGSDGSELGIDGLGLTGRASVGVAF